MFPRLAPFVLGIGAAASAESAEEPRSVPPSPDKPALRLAEFIDNPTTAVGKLARQFKDGDRDGLRTALVGSLHGNLAEGRQSARDILARTRNGLACAKRLSSVMDSVVASLHAAATRHFYPVDNPSAGERIAVVAVGGYGRGTLAPGSDVDLLFLFPDKQTAWGESVVEAMLYPLWDLKLKVGHSVRSVDDCIREGRADMTIRTALLEARLICGDAALFADLQRRYGAEIAEGTAPRLHRGQARRARDPRRPRRLVALSGRAQCQGRQGWPARPQYAVLDRQIFLPRRRFR
jgi:[protein-PII] uridylyltransferase